MAGQGRPGGATLPSCGVRRPPPGRPPPALRSPLSRAARRPPPAARTLTRTQARTGGRGARRAKAKKIPRIEAKILLPGFSPPKGTEKLGSIIRFDGTATFQRVEFLIRPACMVSCAECSLRGGGVIAMCRCPAFGHVRGGGRMDHAWAESSPILGCD